MLDLRFSSLTSILHHSVFFSFCFYFSIFAHAASLVPYRSLSRCLCQSATVLGPPSTRFSIYFYFPTSMLECGEKTKVLLQLQHVFFFYVMCSACLHSTRGIYILIQLINVRHQRSIAHTHIHIESVEAL